MVRSGGGGSGQPRGLAREPEEHPHASRCEDPTPYALVPSPSSGIKDRIGCSGCSRRLPPLAYIIKYIVEGVEVGT